MKSNNITHLTKKMIILIAATCFSTFPAVMIFGKKGFLVFAVLFYWTLMTSFEIAKIKRKEDIYTVSDLLRDRTTNEYKMLQSNESLKNFIGNMKKSQIIFYGIIFGIVMALIPVLLYFFIVGIDKILF